MIIYAYSIVNVETIKNNKYITLYKLVKHPNGLSWKFLDVIDDIPDCIFLENLMYREDLNFSYEKFLQGTYREYHDGDLSEN